MKTNNLLYFIIITGVIIATCTPAQADAPDSVKKEKRDSGMATKEQIEREEWFQGEFFEKHSLIEEGIRKNTWRLKEEAGKIKKESTAVIQYPLTLEEYLKADMPPIQYIIKTDREITIEKIGNSKETMSLINKLSEEGQE